jgi:peptide deformylase
MAVLEILTYPHPVLRQKALPVINFDNDLETLVENMFDTVDYFKGVALAAPQIGILERILVVNYKKKKKILVNPEIIEEEGELVDMEGCLSLPGAGIYVPRAKKIKVEAYNLSGEKIVIKEKGWMARIIQHEFDHLNGMLIIDRDINKNILL